jgi:hypothetical protein
VDQTLVSDKTAAPVPEIVEFFLCATSRVVAGSISDEVTGFFSQVIQSFQLHYGTGVDSACIRNEYQESSWGKRRSVSKFDNPTAIYEPTV